MSKLTLRSPGIQVKKGFISIVFKCSGTTVVHKIEKDLTVTPRDLSLGFHPDQLPPESVKVFEGLACNVYILVSRAVR